MLNKMQGEKIIFSFNNMLQKEIVEFIDGLLSIWKPCDCLIMADEVQDIVPEMSTGGVFSAEFERLVRSGRNSNIGFVIDTQRPAMVKKNVLALTDYLILYRITWSNDLKVVKEIVGNSFTKDKTENLIRNIQKGDFLNGYTIDFL